MISVFVSKSSGTYGEKQHAVHSERRVSGEEGKSEKHGRFMSDPEQKMTTIDT